MAACLTTPTSNQLAEVPGIAWRNLMQYVLKYLLHDKLGSVGLMVLYELPILGIAKCAWTCIEMLHLLRVPNMLLWRLLLFPVDPQPKPVCSVLSWPGGCLSCLLILSLSLSALYSAGLEAACLAC